MAQFAKYSETPLPHYKTPSKTDSGQILESLYMYIEFTQYQNPLYTEHGLCMVSLSTNQIVKRRSG